MFQPGEAGLNIPVTISDIPRLNPDGSGIIEVTTGDVAVPCIGVFQKRRRRGFLLYTIQQLCGINLGLAFERGSMKITYPKMRHRQYRMMKLMPGNDRRTGFASDETLVIPYRLFEFDCGSLNVFYQKFFETRNYLLPKEISRAPISFSEAFGYYEEKFNRDNWREAEGYYTVGTGPSPFDDWQPGWIGGGITELPLLACGSRKSVERSLRTLQFLTRTQTPAGFFYGVVCNGKKFMDDNFQTAGMEQLHLIRKSADVLYFGLKQLAWLKRKALPPQPHLDAALKKTADAFVKLWEEYRQFGQFVNHDTGEIIVGGSTSAAIAPAALALAAKHYGNKKYLQVAEASAQLYYQRDLCAGYTTGGPGEALQCPDSESAFALLESFMALYESTTAEKWLGYAKFAAAYCASWVVGYPYLFPEGSEFYKKSINTTGSVFANLQNKHSAPGICTHSGISLLNLYRYTKEVCYLELLRDIAGGINQYLSTPDRPIMTWDTPSKAMPPGYMNERVNMSDWEGASNIGGVFYGSCWCETSAMLTIAEIPGVYVDLEGQWCLAIDKVYNDGTRDCRVTILAETDRARKKPLGLCPRIHFTELFVPAHTCVPLDLFAIKKE